MMSPHRRTRAMAVFAVAAAGVLPGAAPARAADVFVEVSPSTVQAGSVVDLRAGCADNTTPAAVTSAAFGTVTVQPDNGVLTATATVPGDTAVGGYPVRLQCPDGASASTTLTVDTEARPTRGPDTGFGGTGGGDRGTILLAGGLATVVAGAVLGVSALRRRPKRGMPRTVRSQADR